MTQAYLSILINFGDLCGYKLHPYIYTSPPNSVPRIKLYPHWFPFTHPFTSLLHDCSHSWVMKSLQLGQTLTTKHQHPGQIRSSWPVVRENHRRVIASSWGTVPLRTSHWTMETERMSTMATNSPNSAGRGQRARRDVPLHFFNNSQ